MKSLMLAALLSLSGCTSVYTPIHGEVFVSIKLVNSIDEYPGALGYSTCNGQVCEIKIRRDVYPDCITHEIRHAFEGAFHGNEPSTEDCKVEK